MATPRIRHLLAVLVLGVASQLPAQAQVSSALTGPGDDSSPDTAGVRADDPITPKERPRLQDNEVVSLKRRLQVHGGMSFTYGWAGGGRNFREAGAWVSYFDPESGLGLSVGLSRSSGDMPYSYGYYPSAYDRGGWFPGSPRSSYDVDLFLVRPNFSIGIGFSQAEFSGRPFFDGSGYGLRGPRHF